MKYIPIVLAASVMLAGCTSMETSSQNLFDEFSPSQVAKVVLADYEDPFGDDGLTPSGVSITDSEVIAQIHSACRSTKIRGEVDFPLSGVLGYQIFLDRKGDILAVLHIVNTDSIVIFDKGYWKDGKVETGQPEDEKPSWTMGNSSEYCRIIYSIMKKRLPERIEDLDEMYKERGKTVEEMIFGKVGKANKPGLKEPVAPAPSP